MVIKTRLEKIANLIALEMQWQKTDVTGAINSLEIKGYDRFEMYSAYALHDLPIDPKFSY